MVLTGSVAAQAIGLAASPVISRLFTPADFGVFGTFGAIASVIATVATLDYAQAIMLPREKEDAGQLFLLSCLVTLAATLVCGTVCIVFREWLLGLFQVQSNWLLALLVAAAAIGGLGASFQAWCVRVKAFRHTSTSQLVRGLSSNGLQVGLGIAHAGAPGLLFGSVLADLLAGLNLLRVVRADLRTFLAQAKWRRFKQLAAEYSDFPLYSATENLLNALSAGLPVLLLTHFFGIAVAGAYAFGMRLVSAPMGPVFGALRQVLFQKAGETQHGGDQLSPLFIKSTVGLFALGCVPAILLGIWSPRVFAWVFGDQWRMAGEFARYLAFWLLFVFCNLPAVLFARLIRIQRVLFVYNLVLLIVRMVTLVIGGLYLSALQTVAVFSLVGALMNLVLILFVGRAVLKREGQFSLPQLREALAGLSAR